MPPTASPTTIPSFQFVGNGFCVDSQFRFHSYISSPSGAFSTVNSCNAWCLQSPDNLRGFSYDTNDERCFCLYEVSQLPDPLPAGTASAINNPGSGPITTTVGQLQSVECYTYDIVSILFWLSKKDSMKIVCLTNKCCFDLTTYTLL